MPGSRRHTSVTGVDLLNEGGRLCPIDLSLPGVRHRGIPVLDRAAAIADTVQIEVHGAETHDLVHDVHACE